MAAEVKVVITGDDQTKKATDSAQRNLSGLGNSLKGMLGAGITGLATGAAAAAAGVAAIGTAALGSAMSLDEAYDSIATRTGATGAVLDGLKEDFKAVFTSIPTDAGKAGDVIGDLNTRLGLTGQPLQDMTKSILELSRLTGGDALTNSRAFGRVMGDWGVSADDASKTLDKFFVVGQQTGIGMDSLMQKVVQFGSPLRLMGFSLEESVAMLGKWEKEGVNTELVLGSMRIAAGKFADAGIPLRDGLNETITSIKNAATDSEALGIAMETFGARAGPDMAAAIREGRFGIDELTAAMQGSEGAILKTASATADFPEKLEILKNKAVTALAPLGMVIMDSIGRVLDALTPLIDKLLPAFTAAIEPLMPLIETVLKAVIDFILTTVIPAFQSLVAWVQENWPAISEIVAKAFEAIKSVYESVLKPVIELVVEVLESVVEWVKDNWPLIQKTAETVFSAIKSVIETVMPILKTVVETAFNAIKTTIETVLNVVKGIITAVMKIINGDWEGAWNTVKTTVEGIWEGIKTFISTITDGIFKVLGTSWDNIKTEVESKWNLIKAAIVSEWGKVEIFFNTLPQKLIETGKSIIQGIVDGINQAANVVETTLSGIVNGAIDSIKRALGIASPSKVFAGFGENMMAGLAQGIRRNADMPEVELRGSLSDIAGLGMRPGGAQAQGIGVGGTAYVTVNFYGQQDTAGARDGVSDALRRAGLVVVQ